MKRLPANYLILICLLLPLIYLTSFYSFLLFHSIAEIFSILIAGSVFLFAWNSRNYFRDGYFLFIGIAYLFVAMIDFTHTIAYKGMGVFPRFDANLPTQLWIAARYLESLSLVWAYRYFNRELRPQKILMGFGVLTSMILLSIFYWKIFPDCFVEGKGLTPFKIYSEYLISTILFLAIFLLIKKRQEFDRSIYHLLMASFSLTIIAELSFTFYISVYGVSNLIGHFCKIISFYLVYKAIIETGLNKPYKLLFRELKKNEDRLKQREADLRRINSELSAEILERKQIERALKAEKTFTDTAINAQKDTFYVYALEDGRAVRWNRSFSEITGYSDEEIPSYIAPDEFINESDLLKVQQTTKEVLEKGESTVVLDLIKKDGSTIPMEFNVGLMKLMDQDEHFLLAVGRDMRQRLDAEAKIKASLKEKETLLHEVHHRVKNNLAVISSLLSLQARQTTSSEAEEILKDSKNRIQAMARIHETLYKAEDVSLIEMQDYLLKLVKSIVNSFGDPRMRIRFDVDADGLRFSVGQATSLGLIVNELVTNILKYAFPEERKGHFKVQLLENETSGYCLVVSDNGIGFPGEIDLVSTQTLGLKLVRLLAENQLGGTVKATNNPGADFSICFGS